MGLTSEYSFKVRNNGENNKASLGKKARPLYQPAGTTETGKWGAGRKNEEKGLGAQRAAHRPGQARPESRGKLGALAQS